MTLDWIHVAVAIIGFIASGVAAVWRVSWVVAQMVSKIDKQMADTKAEFHALLELKEAEFGKDIGRVYQRFDEYKMNMESNFVRREMCQLMHNGTTAQLAELSKKIDVQGEKLDALIIKVAGLK